MCSQTAESNSNVCGDAQDETSQAVCSQTAESNGNAHSYSCPLICRLNVVKTSSNLVQAQEQAVKRSDHNNGVVVHVHKHDHRTDEDQTEVVA